MPECSDCSGHVTDRFRAVFGDNDGNVYGCYECIQMNEVLEGKSAQH